MANWHLLLEQTCVHALASFHCSIGKGWRLAEGKRERRRVEGGEAIVYHYASKSAD